MLHTIPTDQCGPRGEAMGEAVSACVHCGFCLPACPTYQTLGEEMDSPRGRIFLMKDVLEDRLSLEQATPYIDRCLGCLGCEPACPSGVPYRQLITSFRFRAETKRRRTLFDRLLRQLVLQTLPYPRRFRTAARFGRVGAWLRPLLPTRLRNMIDMLPEQLPRPVQLPERTAAVGKRRARVALLAGCAQQVLAPEINLAAIRLLSHNGVEVLVPRGQGCCGALAAHTGAEQPAICAATKNLAALPRDVDAIITTAAGCGSGMHEYPLWLKGTPEEALAVEFAELSQDICRFLDELGTVGFRPLAKPQRIAYQDACHLSHGQNVLAQPRRLLRQIENLELVDLPQGEICCGSAGTYNLEEPAIARRLGEQKAAAVAALSPDAVATGNIGCMVQLRNHLRAAGHRIPVRHTVQWLADAITE